MHEVATDEHESKVVTLAETGLGVGIGSISIEARIERGEVSAQDLLIAREIIRAQPDVFTEVDPDAQDDGCGDGRSVVSIYKYDENGDKVSFGKSRRRAKLFGGGLVTTASMLRSIAGPAHNGETVLGDREFAADKLRELGIEHGAHTDNRAGGDKCGCGAIDRYAEITANAVEHRDTIVQTLFGLYGDTFDENIPAIEQVLRTYGVLGEDEQYFKNGSGRQTMDLLEQRGAIIKQLGDDHLEGIVVLNDIEGTTLDQVRMRERLREANVHSDIQAFIVDTWRGRMYADAAAQIAVDNNMAHNFEEARRVAYADFMVRTLAVAVTLTSGDQPIEARLSKDQDHFGLAA